MSYKIGTGSFLNDLERVAKVRNQVAASLGKIAETLKQSEAEAKQHSGELSLKADIEDINIASENLRQGVFRLLVLGDMKRGKSTLLNALIGENLLPNDVNPCTALLTVLRYGPLKKVTIYFNDGTFPEQLSFQEFKQKYTINPTEAKQLEEQKKLAFPNVEYAVVEYPLSLLEKGIEVVDSPGLNDTEARNALSLGYINNCHAILFVLRASQPCTLEERRYLENYIKGRGLSVFFLINAWDEVRDGLIDPDDTEDLQESEQRLRQVFHSTLAEYCQLDGHNIYEERVFEVSSIKALRLRVKDASANLEGTGFPEFMGSLNTFLTQERAIAQMRQARTIARQTYNHVHEAVERRTSLLDQDVKELKAKISSVEPEFGKLHEISEQFKAEIITVRDQKVQAISESFKNYILNLESTFETDFLRYQPDIAFLDFLQKGKRDEFNAAFKQAFEKYINDKISTWELTTEREMQEAFSQLAISAAKYGTNYTQIADSINEKLTGQKVYVNKNSDAEDSSPTWVNWAMGFFSLALGNVAGVALASAGMDWKNILLNSLAVIGIWGFLSVFSVSLITGPVGLLLVGLGVGAFQAEEGRKQLIKATKTEFVKYLPQLAQEQLPAIEQAVKDCFDAYEQEVSKRMNEDIKSRQAELDNLLKQKESIEINLESELDRLQNLDAEVLAECKNVELTYENLVLTSS